MADPMAAAGLCWAYDAPLLLADILELYPQVPLGTVVQTRL